jgi:hypothetical protein
MCIVSLAVFLPRVATSAEVTIPSTVTGVLTIPTGDTGRLSGTVTLDDGVIDVDGTLSSQLGTVRVTGTGQVLLNEPSGRWSYGCCSANSVTIEPGVEVLGQRGTQFASAGTVNRGTFAAVDGGVISGTFTILAPHGFFNEGVLEARSGGALFVSGANAANFGASGTLRAHAGGRILIQGPTITGLSDFGTVENLGGVIQLYSVQLNNQNQTTTFTGGDWSLVSGTRVTGGTLDAAGGGRLRIGTQGSSSFIAANPIGLDAVTLATDAYLGSNGRLKPTNGLTLDDADLIFEGSAYLFVDATSPITGTGEIVSTASGTGRIEAAGGTITIPSTIAVRSSAGSLFFTRQSGAASGDFDIAGSILADGGGVFHSHPLISRGDVTARTGGKIDLDSTWTNMGTMRIETDGILDLGGTLDNQGSLEVENAIILVRGGQISGPGSVSITDSRIFATGSTTLSNLMAITGTRLDRGVYAGTLDLQDGTIEIGTQPGQRFFLADGTLMNGVVNSVDGAELVPVAPSGLGAKARGVLRDLELNANVRVPGGTELTIYGPMTGSGEVFLDGGTLRLGSFQTTPLNGDFINRITPGSGTVYLSGPIEATGGTITLKHGANWIVSHSRSDVFVGGRIEAEPGVTLNVYTGYGSAGLATFRQGVTLAAPMWIRGGFTTGAYVREGLTLDDAVITIGDPSNPEFADTRLVFVGTQTLDGTGEIRFNRPGTVGNPTIPRVNMVSMTGSPVDVLTIGEDIVMRTWEGDGYIGGNYSYQLPPTPINLHSNATLLAENGHTLSLFVREFQQSGVLRAEADSSVVVNVSLQPPEYEVLNRGRIEAAQGHVSFNGGLSLGDESLASVELSLEQLGGDESISVTGTLELGGALEVLLPDDDSWTPAAGDVFTLLAADAGISGQFSNHFLPQLDAGLHWQLGIGPNAVTLEVLDGPLAGDFNADGTRSAADYVAWRKFDNPASGYNAWRANFGPNATSGSSPAAAAPEPGAALIALMAALMFGQLRVPRKTT